MAVPSPEPTAEQIEIVGQIMKISDSAEVLSIISNYDQETADAKWALALPYITSWATVKNISRTKKVGEIEFFPGVSAANKLAFRNELLTLYGQDELRSEGYSRSTSKDICFGY